MHTPLPNTRPTPAVVTRRNSRTDPSHGPGETREEIVATVQRRVLASHRQLLESARGDPAARKHLYNLVRNILIEERLLDPREREERAAESVSHELLGYGPLTGLLADPEVTEVMVNGPREIWVERSGCLARTPLVFRDVEHLLDVAERIFAPLGRRLDQSHPWADGRLPDGCRVHALLPPLAVNGPYLTVRKFNHRMFSLDELVRQGTMSARTAAYLATAVREAKNLVISGSAGTGKTTLLNALSSTIPEHERVITVEDAAELRLQHHHWVRLEGRTANAEGRGQVGLRDLLRNALRMRPDRIIVGEIRGPEAFELLTALTAGHRGAMVTVHASSAGQALHRLEHLVQMAGTDIPHAVVRTQIRQVVDIVVHMFRRPDGLRLVDTVAGVDDTGLLGLGTGATVVRGAVS